PKGLYFIFPSYITVRRSRSRVVRIAIHDYIRFYISSVCGSVLPISWVNVELVGTYVDLMITFAVSL
ncbi:MAG: hypothetical protein WBM18_05700, partial [Bacillota bacterium]